MPGSQEIPVPYTDFSNRSHVRENDTKTHSKESIYAANKYDESDTGTVDVHNEPPAEKLRYNHDPQTTFPEEIQGEQDSNSVRVTLKSLDTRSSHNSSPTSNPAFSIPQDLLDTEDDDLVLGTSNTSRFNVIDLNETPHPSDRTFTSSSSSWTPNIVNPISLGLDFPQFPDDSIQIENGNYLLHSRKYGHGPTQLRGVFDMTDNQEYRIVAEKKHRYKRLSGKLVNPLSKIQNIKTNDIVPPLAMYCHSPKVTGILPPQINGHVCVTVESRIFIFGGRTYDGNSNNLYIYDCNTNITTQPVIRGDIPPPLRGMGGANHLDYIFYFGGADEAQACRDSFYALNINTFVFTKISPTGRLPMGRTGHSCISHDGKIYIFGGSNKQSSLNDVWKLDVSKGINQCSLNEVISLEKDTKNWPNGRHNHSAHIVQHLQNLDAPSMVIYGGNDQSKVFDDVWMFDLITAKWKRLKTYKFDQKRRLYKRFSFSSTLHSSINGGRWLLIIGGYDGKHFSQMLTFLNLVSGEWTVRPSYGLVSNGLCCHRGVYYDGRCFLFGGFDMAYKQCGIRLLEIPLAALRMSQF